MTTTQSDYYTSTAYDSTNKRVLPPLDRPKQSQVERFVRKFPLSTRGCHCKEFLISKVQPMMAQELKDMEQSEYQEVLDSTLHQIFELTSSKNRKATVESYVFMAWWFWFFGGIFSIFFGLIVGFNMGMFYGIITLVFIPFLLWCLGKLAIAREWVTDGNNIQFNRQTGMISFPWKKGRVTLPFDEFDPYLSDFVTYAATQKQFLRLVHRYSMKNFITSSYYDFNWELQMQWEEIQRIMDISQPIPDTPKYDFVRVNDPVSNEYDKKYHRPEHYWKNQNVEDVEEMVVASRNACKKFPWGKTREQAIQEGWRPSGFGGGSWQTQK